MSDIRQTLAVVGLAVATLAAALYGPSHGSPEPVIMLTIMVAALTAAIAGLAFSAICGAVLLHVIDDPIRVLLLLSVCSFANQILTVWSLRRDVRWRRLGGLVGGGAAGILPGVWVLVHADQRLITNGIGVILLAYAVNLVIGKLPRLTIDSRWADAAVGFTAGAAGAVAALPSLPVTIWCQTRGFQKDALRATVQPFILAMQIMTLPFILGGAPAASAIGPADLLCIPAGLFGTQIGLGCASGLSNRQFVLAVAGLLAICAVSFWI